MKKTTIILGAAIGVFFVGSFFSPLIFGRKAESRHSLVFKAVNKTDTLVINHPIESLIIQSPDCPISIMEADQSKLHSTGLRLTIKESQSVSDPILIADESWISNTQVENNGTNTIISFPMKEMYEKDDYYSYLSIPADNASIGQLILPKGTLHQLQTTSINVTLQSFQDADLTLLNPSNVTCTDCSFRTLSNR